MPLSSLGNEAGSVDVKQEKDKVVTKQTFATQEGTGESAWGGSVRGHSGQSPGPSSTRVSCEEPNTSQVDFRFLKMLSIRYYSGSRGLAPQGESGGPRIVAWLTPKTGRACWAHETILSLILILILSLVLILLRATTASQAATKCGRETRTRRLT